MAKESVIRDKLSAALEILEPGLALIEVNHKLPNAVGAKGFIDILAKDRFGNLVIIELKRSDQAAREALFEILKYMPLFRRQHGVPAHRIRCFIVSTAWHELLVPFSEFRRVAETQTEGFRIKVDEDGTVLDAERVTDHVEEDTAQPFKAPCAYLYPSAGEREAALPLIRASLTARGARGYLLLRMDYRGGSERIIYPFGAYLVPTRVEAGVLASLNRTAAEGLKEEEGELHHAAAVSSYVEHLFLGEVSEALSEHFRSTNLEVSAASAETFSGMLAGGWVVLSIERVGPYSSAAVMPDAELIDMVKGVAGASNVRFWKMTSPRHHLDWMEVKKGAANCLHGNPTWQAGFSWFLDKVEREFPDGTLLAKVYNPLRLPESLYQTAVTQTSEYLPELALTVLPAGDGTIEALFGSIVWDGKLVPKAAEEVFTEDLCGDVADYYFANAAGAAWELDGELMRRHGLEYSLWWITFGKDVKQARKLIVTEAGLIDTGPEGPKPDSLSDYFDAARPYLEKLFAEIDNCVGRT